MLQDLRVCRTVCLCVDTVPTRQQAWCRVWSALATATPLSPQLVATRTARLALPIPTLTSQPHLTKSSADVSNLD